VVTAGADVFIEGDPCPGLWLLARGRVRVYHSSADGRQRIVSFAMRSSPLELGAALDGRPFSAGATALDDSVLILIPRRELLDLGRRHLGTVRKAVDQLCLEIRQRDIASTIATLKDARGKVGCALLQLARQYGVPTPAGIRIDYRLSRQDIADRAGVRIETVIRILSDLSRQGAVRTEDQRIEIADLSALQSASACEECQFDCSVFAPPYSSSVS
jgi:CRP/FNR family transcriptional regulator